jgi:hypothetical protein
MSGEKYITSIRISKAVHEMAKKYGLNVSRFVEESLIQYFSEKETYEDTIPILIDEEIIKFVEIAKINDEWEKFANAWSRVIQNRHGIYIMPTKVIHLVRKKIQEVN